MKQRPSPRRDTILPRRPRQRARRGVHLSRAEYLRLRNAADILTGVAEIIRETLGEVGH